MQVSDPRAEGREGGAPAPEDTPRLPPPCVRCQRPVLSAYPPLSVFSPLMPCGGGPRGHIPRLQREKGKRALEAERGRWMGGREGGNSVHLIDPCPAHDAVTGSVADGSGTSGDGRGGESTGATSGSCRHHGPGQRVLLPRGAREVRWGRNLEGFSSFIHGAGEGGHKCSGKPRLVGHAGNALPDCLPAFLARIPA